MTKDGLVHVRAIASNRVHLLQFSEHSTYKKYFEEDDFRHDGSSHPVTYIALPVSTLCGAKIGNRSQEVVLMRGWNPKELCRTCRKMADR